MADTVDKIHTYPDGIKINTSIPATMTQRGLHYLGRLARSVPEGGTIVEVGPLYGSSTWVLANNSHPSVKIWSLDTWEAAAWIPRRLPDAPEFGIEAFKHFTRDCANVTAVQGWSPDSVSDWDRPIDLFFDDATHGDPGFSANVNFFKPFVKPDGILCGDDFASGWPDIIRVVTELAATWEAEPEVSGRVWSVLCDGGRQGPLRKVSEKVGSWTDGGDIRVTVKTQSGASYTGEPRMWAGRIGHLDPVIGLGLHPIERASVNGTFDVWLQNGDVKRGLSFGVDHSFDAPIVNFSTSLDEESQKKFDVDYQVCEISNADDGRLTLNSRASKNGLEIVKEKDTAVSAVRIDVLKRGNRITKEEEPAPTQPVPAPSRLQVARQEADELREKLDSETAKLKKARAELKVLRAKLKAATS